MDHSAWWQTRSGRTTRITAALGGPLTSPEQFVNDPVARSYYQQRLSYIINRWGYSPDLLAWEWWNEVDLTPISEKALIPWLQEMTAYLKQRDVNQHLTTNSFSVRSWSPVWKLPELDIVQVHEYSEQITLMMIETQRTELDRISKPYPTDCTGETHPAGGIRLLSARLWG